MADLIPAGPSGEPVDYEASFVGRGLGWPVGVDHTGAIRLTSANEGIEDSMQLVLLTAPGERVMRPAFGCRIWDLLFEPVTPNLLGLINEAVRDALGRWEPRIEVEDVAAAADDDDHALVRVLITYRVRATNDRRNLVYPFYVIPHGAE
jgi:uncharacterized protein